MNLRAMVVCRSTVGLALVVAVCALAVSCGRRGEEHGEALTGEPPPGEVRGDVEDGDPAPSSTGGAIARSRLGYEVEARASSRFGVGEGTTSESLEARYALAVERVALDGLFTLTITPELESVSDGLEWLEGALPGEWQRQYRDNGDFAGGREPADVGVFDWATHNLFSVSHLVLSLPSFRLEAGESWRRTDRHPNGRMETEFELIEVTDDRVTLTSSTVFTPFADDGTISWKETIAGTYDRVTRMAIEVEVRHERRLSGLVERNGTPVPITSTVTTDRTVRRVSG